VTTLRRCRSCSGAELKTFLDLGVHPIANALLDSGQLDSPEDKYPLQVAFCSNCGLVQTTETIPADVLFGREYPYYSSFIPGLLAHSCEHVGSLLTERKLGAGSLVVEVASNDGYLLRNFVEAGIPVLGIEPAAGPAEAALRQGVPTRNAFFNSALAHELAGQADIVIANNVVAHVDTINDFVAGLHVILKDDGFASLEFAYLRDLIEKSEFDTIYHEHVFYHSLTAIEPLLLRHGLYLNDAQRLAIHGGSLRVRASKRPGRSGRLDNLQNEERSLGMDALPYYLSFSERVDVLRDRLTMLLKQTRAKGARLAAYGAAAKGATLLNSLPLEPDLLEFVVDRNPHKVGKFMPGVRLPIRALECLEQERPDYLLILAWNFADEIMEQNHSYGAAGGRFIVPVPEPRII
jgi:SAM-dependent methyltransferase